MSLVKQVVRRPAPRVTIENPRTGRRYNRAWTTARIIIRNQGYKLVKS